MHAYTMLTIHILPLRDDCLQRSDQQLGFHPQPFHPEKKKKPLRMTSAPCKNEIEENRKEIR